MKTSCPACRAPILSRSRWEVTDQPLGWRERYECGAVWWWGEGARVLTPCPVVTRPNETTSKEVR